MASAFIVRRKTAAGSTRHAVRYRLGGRTYPVEHGGSFPTKREADRRRDLIAGELAAGRNPALVLAELTASPAPVKTLAQIAPPYLARRKTDMADIRPIESHMKKIIEWGGNRDPHSLTRHDAQDFITFLADLAPGSVRRYNDTFKLLLDEADCDPNPARDSRVKLPRMTAEEPTPPTGRQFLAILDTVPRRYRLPFCVQEQCGMHIGEVASLAWGDVDVAESRFRLKRSNVKGGYDARARWVQVPEWLMDAIAELCPLEDRTAERRVFIGLSDRAARAAMARACTAAGIPHFSPKDLRHRRATIWHHGGLPAKVLAERLGHATATLSLNTYSHVVDPGECELKELRARVDNGPKSLD